MRGTMLAGIGVLVASALMVAWVTWNHRAGSADAGDPTLVALGGEVYQAHCAACHGVRLEGEPDWRRPLPSGGLPAPPHDASGHTWHHPDTLLFRYTKEGGQALVGPRFQSNMPGFGNVLSDREIWAALAYIKAQWPPDIRARQAELN